MRSKTIYLLLFFCLAVLGFAPNKGDKSFYIPARNIQPYVLTGMPQNTFTATMDSFEISPLVTYAQYKVYLKEMQADSSVSFYQSQLPDSEMCRKDVYEIYVSSTKYDNYPIMGISWEAAMNFCRWMTINANKDSLIYMYCLPSFSQWVDGYDYLKGKSIENDFNKEYSDWLLNSKDESWYFSDSKDIADYAYFSIKGDARVLKRKLVIGDSYLFTRRILFDYHSFSYFSDQGYRQVGFRYVKHKIKCSKLHYDNSYMGKYDTEILKHWGLYNKLK